MEKREYQEPTQEEMVKAIYNNVCRKICPECGKRFVDKGGYGLCYPCSQDDKQKKSGSNLDDIF